MPAPDGRLARLEALALHGAKALAVGGGLLMVAAAAMVTASVFSRRFLGRQIPGDFELTQMACGIAVFWFLPYCQIRLGHVMVDFFTAKAPARARGALDGLSAIAFTVVAVLIAWRMAIAVMEVGRIGTTTMVLQLPQVYAMAIAYVGAIGLVFAAAFGAIEPLRLAIRGR